VVLFHDVVEVFDLADRDRGPMRLVVAFDGGFIGVTAVNRDRLGDAIATDGLLEKPYCGLFVSMFGGSCTWPLRVNTSDSPVALLKIKKVYKKRLS
jgi:hypothetical protein